MGINKKTPIGHTQEWVHIFRADNTDQYITKKMFDLMRSYESPGMKLEFAQIVKHEPATEEEVNALNGRVVPANAVLEDGQTPEQWFEEYKRIKRSRYGITTALETSPSPVPSNITDTKVEAETAQPEKRVPWNKGLKKDTTVK